MQDFTAGSLQKGIELTEIARTKTDGLEKSFGLLFIIYAVVAPLSISATYISLGLIVIAGAVLLFRKGGNPLGFQMNLLIPFCLLYIWSVMTALMAGSFSSESTFRGIKELSPIILFPLFLRNARVEKEKIIMALILSASMVCLLGLIQFFVPSVVYPIQQQIIWEGEFRGFFGGMNHFGSGGYFSITTVLTFALILFWRCGYIKKSFLCLFFLLNVVALSLTLARSYYVSVVLILILLLIVKNWKWSVLLSVVLFAAFYSFHTFPSHVINRFQSTFDRNDSSATERLHIWRAAIEMIKEHPIAGVGKGNWGKVAKEVYFPRFDRIWQPTESAYVNAHNVYLSILAETGIIGLLLFILFWGTILWTLFNRMSSLQSGSFDYALIIGIIFCLGNLFVAGLFEYNFDTLVVLLLISFIVGVSLPIYSGAVIVTERKQ